MDSRSIYLIVLLVCHSSQKMSKNFGGPFDAIIQRLEKCEDQGAGQLRVLSHRISRISRTKFSFSSPVEIAIPVDEKITVKVDMSVWGNGGWKPNYYHTELQDPCVQGKKQFTSFFNDILKSGNLTDCLIPAGSYIIKDLILEPDLGLKLLAYNKLKIEATCWVENKKVCCEKVYVDIVPKAVKRKP